MSSWQIASAVLLVGAILPATVLGIRGGTAARLVGLELLGAVLTLETMVMAQIQKQSSYLIVPLVLALLSFTGTLVFTRVLRGRPSRGAA